MVLYQKVEAFIYKKLQKKYPCILSSIRNLLILDTLSVKLILEQYDSSKFWENPLQAVLPWENFIKMNELCTLLLAVGDNNDQISGLLLADK